MVALPQIAGGDTRATSTYLACDQKGGSSRIVFWERPYQIWAISSWSVCMLTATWHSGMHATCTSPKLCALSWPLKQNRSRRLHLWSKPTNASFWFKPNSQNFEGGLRPCKPYTISDKPIFFWFKPILVMWWFKPYLHGLNHNWCSSCFAANPIHPHMPVRAVLSQRATRRTPLRRSNMDPPVAFMV